ncbi:MAG: hypothetical protein GQ565_11480 [Candidatus Aegiribacteria sp.]|nr:hypothetical protein [Candidatus Aegiribacteria sp.]
MKDLVERRNGLLREFEKCSDFVRGSINSVCAKCNRARCICETKTSRRAYRLTYKNSEQKTRIVYIQESRLPKIRKMIVNYSKSRKIMEQIIETNIEIFKKETKH